MAAAYQFNATFTNGSAVVDAALAAFVANAKIGDLIRAPDERMYFVSAVNSNTQITLSRNYVGTTTTAAAELSRTGSGWNSAVEANVRLARIEESLARGYTLQSDASLAIGAGSKIFTNVEPGLNILDNIRFEATSRANPANKMRGHCTYAGSTLTMTVPAGGFSGSGTFADWNLNIIGADGATGAQGGAATTPGSTTIGHVPTWANNSGTALGAGHPVGTSGASIPLLNGANTFSGSNTFTNSNIALAHTIITSAAPHSGSMVMQRARGSLGSESAVLSGDTLGGLNIRGYGATGYATTGRATFSFRAAENWTDTAQGTDFILETANVGGTGRTVRATIYQGLLMGAATGGDKGHGTINATAVYDDNSLLTCMAMAKEFIDEGRIDLDKWDAFAPNIEIPEHREEIPATFNSTVVQPCEEIRETDGRLVRRTVDREIEIERPLVYAEPVYDETGNLVLVVETPVMDEIVTPAQTIVREHRTARVFQAMLDSGFDPRDPEQYFAKMRADEALPGMPNQQDWQHNALSIGEQHSRKWLAMEMLAIVCNVMWGKIKDHEARIAALETA